MSAVSIEQVLVVGAGYTGQAVAELARARGLRVSCTVRSDARAEALRARGFRVLQAPRAEVELANEVDAHTLVVVAFPPDGETDAALAPALGHAAALRYVSTTGVYPSDVRHIDAHTAPSASPSPAHQAVLEAERAWRGVGALVLRCPGIYGPDRGLHVRVAHGKHRLVGDGHNVLSRIHVEDLAALLLARPEVRDRTLVVGDGGRDSQREVVRWIAEEYGVPMPESVDPESVHPSLRANRHIDPSEALHTLGVSLRFPSFREGMARAASRIPAPVAG